MGGGSPTVGGTSPGVSNPPTFQDTDHIYEIAGNGWPTVGGTSTNPPTLPMIFRTLLRRVDYFLQHFSLKSPDRKHTLYYQMYPAAGRADLPGFKKGGPTFLNWVFYGYLWLLHVIEYLLLKLKYVTIWGQLWCILENGIAGIVFLASKCKTAFNDSSANICNSKKYFPEIE